MPSLDPERSKAYVLALTWAEGAGCGQTVGYGCARSPFRPTLRLLCYFPSHCATRSHVSAPYPMPLALPEDSRVPPCYPVKTWDSGGLVCSCFLQGHAPICLATKVAVTCHHHLQRELPLSQPPVCCDGSSPLPAACKALLEAAGHWSHSLWAHSPAGLAHSSCWLIVGGAA